jgi:DNA-binding GntR family transcriptional regulator
MPPLSQSQLADLMHVRQLLEVDAARRAASRVILADLRAMEREISAMEALRPAPRFRDFNVYIQHDQTFHQLVVGASGNPVLLETYRGLNVHVQLARLVHELGEFDYSDNAVEHRAIYDALKARDADAAADAVRVHIQRFEWDIGECLDRRTARAAAE